jgi:predicted MFS family arabinose efflux permease
MTFQLGVLVFARLIISTARRMMYIFALAFSRGLGVPLLSITSLMAVNSAAGIFCPVFGFLGDRWGYKLAMMTGVGLLGVGMLAGGFFPGYGTLLVALLMAGLSKAIFDPITQAYVGEQVPYRRRGFAIGLLEMSWAGSILIGIPLVGLLIDRFGWRSPLLVLGGLGVISFVAVALFIPRDRRPRIPKSESSSLRQTWVQVRHNRPVLFALGFTFFLAAANDILFVVYGVWMGSGFGLTVTALGAATMVIGVAEMLGEGMTAFLSDRIGLGRSLLIGMISTMLSYLLLLLVGDSFPLALAAIFMIFLVFEFTIVTSFAYFTELLPGARATMMSFNLAAGSLGRVVGALLGGAIWLSGGMAATSLSAALASGFALVCLMVVLCRGE